MTKATEYVSHMYSQFEGRAAVTVGVNSGSETIHPFVYENNSQIPIGLIAMSVDNISDSSEVDVYHISTFKPGNGQGSEIMSYLCNVADEFKVRLCIQAEAQFSGRRTLTGADLINWYRKFGFYGNGTMYREPKNNMNAGGGQPFHIKWTHCCPTYSSFRHVFSRNPVT